MSYHRNEKEGELSFTVRFIVHRMAYNQKGGGGKSFYNKISFIHCLEKVDLKTLTVSRITCYYRLHERLEDGMYAYFVGPKDLAPRHDLRRGVAVFIS